MTPLMWSLMGLSWCVLGLGLTVVIVRAANPKRRAQHAMDVLRKQTRLDIEYALRKAGVR